jgi:hypothetical protein
MDYLFVCKLFRGNSLLGTAFLIKNNVLYSANHNFKKSSDYNDCYVVYNDGEQKKYYFKFVNEIEALDLVEITLKEEIPISNIPNISMEYIDEEEKLSGYGYKEVDGVSGVLIKLEKYDHISDGIADDFFMVKDEEDGARWNGISGGPIFTKNSVRGMIIMNYGGDGIKTRIKTISFNKIINYLIEDNRMDIIENLPQLHVSSELNERLCCNSKLCNKLYYSSNYEFENDNMNFMLSFLKVEDDRTVNIKKYSYEIRKTIENYALTLEDRYVGSKNGYLDLDKIQKISRRIDEVKEKIKYNFNSAYIILWILSEGIMNIPRIGKVLVEKNGEYYEEDIYFKKREKGITLFIPLISVYEELSLSLERVIDSVCEKSEEGYIEFSRIEWDPKAIECLDYISQIEIGKLIRNEYSKEIDIEVTAVSIYNSNIYDNIPVVVNNENKINWYFTDKFKKDIMKDISKYNGLLKLSSNINKIKVNLFILPMSEIKIIENI